MTVEFSDEICSAMEEGVCIECYYDDLRRVVEPHVLGKNQNTGNYLLRCYQIQGGSVSGEMPGWKLFETNKISKLKITNIPSEAPRVDHDYNPQDTIMTEGIICSVPILDNGP